MTMCEQDQVESMLKHVVNDYKETRTCVILDDCASSKDVKGRTSEVVKLGFSARHYGLSVIVLTQQLPSIAKAFRENITRLVDLVVFFNSSKKDMESIIQDYLYGVDKAEVERITRHLRRQKYAKVVINLGSPNDHTLD